MAVFRVRYCFLFFNDLPKILEEGYSFGGFRVRVLYEDGVVLVVLAFAVLQVVVKNYENYRIIDFENMNLLVTLNKLKEWYLEEVGLVIRNI